MASIGNHMKMNVSHRLKEQVRKFYPQVLGCKMLPSPAPDLDLYEFEGGFVLGVFFCEDAEVLPEQEHLKATWLEIKVADPQEVKQRLLEFGVKEVDYVDKSRFFFQAPGGQVFRLAPLSGGI